MRAGAQSHFVAAAVEVVNVTCVMLLPALSSVMFEAVSVVLLPEGTGLGLAVNELISDSDGKKLHFVFVKRRVAKWVSSI